MNGCLAFLLGMWSGGIVGLVTTCVMTVSGKQSRIEEQAEK